MNSNVENPQEGRFAPRSARDFEAVIGSTVGVTGWHAVGQADIDSFAAATGDFQWIHVDVVRAGASPLGTTIAHGLYTLSLGPKLTQELLDLSGFSYSLNYGYERVRFPAPLTTGSRLRMSLGVVELKLVGTKAVNVTLRQTFESDSTERPVCVADTVVRLAP